MVVQKKKADSGKL